MELAQWKTALDTILQDQEASMLALLEELVGIDSPTAHADGVNRMGERLTAWLGEAGFQVRRLPKPPVPEDEAWRRTWATSSRQERMRPKPVRVSPLSGIWTRCFPWARPRPAPFAWTGRRTEPLDREWRT